LDTKLKGFKPAWSWISFFLGVNIAVFLLFSCLAALVHSGGNVQVLKEPFSPYENTIAFKEQTAGLFDQLTYLATTDSPGDSLPQRVTDEGDNLICGVINESTGLTLKNLEKGFSFPASGAMPVLPDGYSYFWYFDGQNLHVINEGRLVDVDRIDSGYREIVRRLMINDQYNDDPLAQRSDIQIILAVKDTLEENPYGISNYYREQKFLSVIGFVYGGLALLTLTLLTLAWLTRQSKRQFDRILAAWSGRLWIEVKGVLSFLALFFLMILLGTVWVDSAPFTPYFMLRLLLAVLALLMVGWWFYLMLIDLLVNRQAFWSHNLINSGLAWYRKFEVRYPWQKMLLRRAYALLALETVLALLAVFFLLASFNSGFGGFMAFVMALIFTAIGIYLIFRYLKRYHQTLTSWGQIIDQIELIKAGNMTTRLELPENDDMYPAAQNLNSVQEGMSIAVADKTRSDRMKVELITNVSHDLKTPLTSIISYVHLLAQEKDLPLHVNDYVEILLQKSERLKNLIQDLFDLSKASSDNIALDLEKIDLALLIKQTLADMEEQIAASGLAFRLNIPNEPVYIVSDGKKLYRVWENLIANALKYSLTGSRVFIDLNVDNQEILATIKNTANYEMTFRENEILQRFVRGDEARTTEGSGLGLSIAQSFTHICGGRFSIKIEGDLFKVELRFNPV